VSVVPFVPLRVTPASHWPPRDGGSRAVALFDEADEPLGDVDVVELALFFGLLPPASA